MLDATSVHPESYEAAKNCLKTGLYKGCQNQIAARRAEEKRESYQKCDRHQDKTDIKTLNNHGDSNTGIKPNGLRLAVPWLNCC